MISRRILGTVIFVSLGLTACGNANFFGGSKKKKSSVVAQQPAPSAKPSSVPQIGPSDQILQPDPNTIVFGRDKVFHIGDNDYENTSCKEQVSTLPLEGNAYFFQFEVLNDRTNVSINVGKICGVDYNSNVYELYSGSSRIQGTYIQRLGTSVDGKNIALNRGKYSVVLASGLGRYNNSSKSDLDDYIVGNVTVRGNQAIKPINYGSYKK